MTTRWCNFSNSLATWQIFPTRSLSLFCTHTYTQFCRRKKQKKAEPLPFIRAWSLRLALRSPVGTVSVKIDYSVNMIHLPSLDLDLFADFSVWSPSAGLHRHRQETAASSPPYPLSREGEAVIITALAAMRRITGKAKDETLIELQSARAAGNRINARFYF